jgi:Carboxypeptidase regulatory-like domain
MANKSLLNRIDVKSPCNESWDEMVGNNEVRFCSHCVKDVHDLSAMKRADAERLVQKSSGNLCVRYIKTPTGKLITAPPKFTQIRRNATIAASVLATSLTFTTLAYAQGEPIKPKDNVTQTNKDKSANSEIKQGFATVSGVVKDANDAVIQKAKVILRDTKTGKTFQTLSNDEGIYEFNNVEPSIYELSIESMGFKKSIWQNIKIENDTKFENTVVLEVGEATMGIVGISEEPLTATETKIETKIQEKQIVELPINGRTFATMGLFPGVRADEKPIKPKKKKKKN